MPVPAHAKVNQPANILLTGFTGVLGKRMAYRLAALGHDVYCLIRAGSEAEARKRLVVGWELLSEVLPDFDGSVEKRIHPVPGDVRQKGLGIHASFLRKLQGNQTQGIWHLAALLDLTETNSREVYNTNYLGTMNVLDFARQQGIPELHYFSTFGASGRVEQAVVREIPGIKPPSFRNTYERSKWEAERRIWHAQVRGELLVTIYRPSIVVGDSIHGRYEQFNVFNHAFHLGSRVRKKLCEKLGLDSQKDTLKYELRTIGDTNASFNIVPIDFVVETAIRLYTAPRSRGRVYHIVNPDPPTLHLGMELFRKHEPWDGLRWEMFDPAQGFLNQYEKFINKQLSFLVPYMTNRSVYDFSNVHAVLALHGGLPALENKAFLEAIFRRATQHGWQEQANGQDPFEQPAPEPAPSEFTWPEDSDMVVDFAPGHSLHRKPERPANYPLADRLLGNVYWFREKLAATLDIGSGRSAATGRDIVMVPIGLGATRRGEAEFLCYQHNERLAKEVFTQANQVVGFDLRAFAGQGIPGHEHLGAMHENGCWAMADDLIHSVRLLRDLQRTGCVDWIQRLQILPFSAGTYLAGWISGVLSFHDMLLLAHQCMHLLAEDELLVSLADTERWFFSEKEKLTEWQRDLLRGIRQKVDPGLRLGRAELASQLHGRLELVFALNAQVLRKLVDDTRNDRIGVSVAMTLSPNSAVFAGNELEMTRFRGLFAGKRKIELRRVPIDVRGTPHCSRLKRAGQHTTEILKLYEKQGRLRDPLIPFPSHTGEWVRTKEQFIQAVAGIPDQTCYFDAMIERVLEGGGRDFLLIQSGMSTAAGDLFEGVIRSNAMAKGCQRVRIHRPAVGSPDPHPICEALARNDRRRSSQALDQSLSDTIRWYEDQMSRMLQEV